MVSIVDVTLVTRGQLVTPRNGGYGAMPGLGLVVRGSPRSPVSMLARAMIANVVKTAGAVAHPGRHDHRRPSAAVCPGAVSINGAEPPPTAAISWYRGDSSCGPWPSIGLLACSAARYLMFDPQASRRATEGQGLKSTTGPK